MREREREKLMRAVNGSIGNKLSLRRRGVKKGEEEERKRKGGKED